MVLGIRIITTGPIFSDVDRKRVWYNLVIADLPRGTEFFFTNQRIKKSIQKHALRPRTHIGHIIYDIDFKNKLIVSFEFYPKGNPEIQSIFVSIFKKTGLASEVEKLIQKNFLELFSDYHITTSRAFKLARERQLRKRGVDPYAKIPLKESVEILTKYIRRKSFLARIHDTKKRRVRRFSTKKPKFKLKPR